jgi:hypothetical protein|tara:strand:- start:72 stop:233 length:162 start_codon:yes stop_codon:yes gene_type:complete
MFTFSEAVSVAISEAVVEGLRSVDGIEAAAHSLGTTAGSGAAAATTEALATVA